MKLDLVEIQMITQAVGAATIRGKDAPTVATILLKLEKEFDRLEKIEKKQQTEIFLNEG